MAITNEFLALANHRKGIRAEIARTAERLRKMQLEAVSEILRGYRLDLTVVTPIALLFVMQSVPRTMMIEETLGISSGHADVVAMVQHYLTELEGPRHSTA
jgi:TetR/AcrR family transcriptional regulator